MTESPPETIVAVALPDALGESEEIPIGIRLRIAIDLLMQLEDEGTLIAPRSASSALRLASVQVMADGSAVVPRPAKDCGAAELLWEVIAAQPLGDGPPPRVREVASDVPEPVDELVARALEPAMRETRVGELRDALEEAGRGVADTHEDVRRALRLEGATSSAPPVAEETERPAPATEEEAIVDRRDGTAERDVVDPRTTATPLLGTRRPPSAPPARSEAASPKVIVATPVLVDPRHVETQPGLKRPRAAAKSAAPPKWVGKSTQRGLAGAGAAELEALATVEGHRTDRGELLGRPDRSRVLAGFALSVLVAGLAVVLMASRGGAASGSTTAPARAAETARAALPRAPAEMAPLPEASASATISALPEGAVATWQPRDSRGRPLGPPRPIVRPSASAAPPAPPPTTSPPRLGAPKRDPHEGVTSPGY